MKIKIKLDEHAIMPTRAHKYDAGLDLYAPEYTAVTRSIAGESYHRAISSVKIGYATIDTGVHIAIPKGYVGYVKSKSGLNVKHGLTAEGVIDSGYTGSIKVKLYNHTDEPYYIERGDKIAQLVIQPIVTPKLKLVRKLGKTERGDGGFGSTGR